MSMSVRVAEERSASPAEWDAAWHASPHATYFQSREWAEIWWAYSDGAMVPDGRVLTLSDGAEVVMPLTHERLPHYRGVRHWSSPAGTYGGWLTGDKLAPGHARALFEHVTGSTPGLWWRLNPFDPQCAALCELATEYDDTHAIPLTRGFDSVCTTAGHGHRSSVNKAIREGVSVRRGGSLDDWRAYYQVYEASLRRWGDSASSEYGWPLFEEMARRASSAIELWLAVCDEQVIAGGVCLHAARHVAYWHAAARGEFFHLRAANLLVHAMVDDACRRGLEWFDLNPSGGHDGVRVFKERCGGEALPSPIVSRLASGRRVPARVSAVVGHIRAVVGRGPTGGDGGRAKGAGGR